MKLYTGVNFNGYPSVTFTSSIDEGKDDKTGIKSCSSANTIAVSFIFPVIPSDVSRIDAIILACPTSEGIDNTEIFFGLVSALCGKLPRG